MKKTHHNAHPSPTKGEGRRDVIPAGRGGRVRNMHADFPSPLEGEGRRDVIPAGRGGRVPTKIFAKQLRTNQTPTEKDLWRELRGRRFLGFKFKRQVPLGPYIVDFACFDPKLILELDGSQHAKTIARQKDEQRDQYFKKRGYQIRRYWNSELTRGIEWVLSDIFNQLNIFLGGRLSTQIAWAPAKEWRPSSSLIHRNPPHPVALHAPTLSLQGRGKTPNHRFKPPPHPVALHAPTLSHERRGKK